MAHGRTLELAKIQPLDRVAIPMPPSGRRDQKRQPHHREGPQRATRRLMSTRGAGRPRLVATAESEPAVWQTTKRRPWTVKAERRAANRRARASRRANRR